MDRSRLIGEAISAGRTSPSDERMRSPRRGRMLAGLWWRTVVGAAYLRASFSKKRKRYPRVCNICGYEGYFGPSNGGTRIDAKCPRCKSHDRYRLFKLWLDRNGARLRGGDVLHFAPEKCMVMLIKPLARTYRTADIEPGRGDIVLNIEAIDLPSTTLDCVVCSHVLEHVNDRKALAEMYRVLRPSGFAVLMTPVVEGWSRTYENAGITTPTERALHFGQCNHVRYHGADLRERIQAAGFTLAEFTAEGPDAVRYGLMRGEKVFIATRAR